MDETSPVYENFLNNMSRLGRTPRETTRRVSADKFLGKNNLESKVESNARKISILTKLIKIKRVKTGQMLATLSESSPIKNIDKNIEEITKLVISIADTLKRQEKLELKILEEERKRMERMRRTKRENILETKKPNLALGLIDRITRPVRNLFNRIFGFLFNILVGKGLVSLIDFLSNPANAGKLQSMIEFFKKTWPVITAGIVGLAAVLAATLLKMTGSFIPAMIAATGALLSNPLVQGAALLFGVPAIINALRGGGEGGGDSGASNNTLNINPPSNNNIQNFLMGGEEKETGLARVHKDEFVLTPQGKEANGLENLEAANDGVFGLDKLTGVSSPVMAMTKPQTFFKGGFVDNSTSISGGDIKISEIEPLPRRGGMSMSSTNIISGSSPMENILNTASVPDISVPTGVNEKEVKNVLGIIV